MRNNQGNDEGGDRSETLRLIEKAVETGVESPSVVDKTCRRTEPLSTI